MVKTLKFILEKETPGAVRYQELDAAGKKQTLANAVIGQLYMRKSAMTHDQGVIPPKFVKIEIEY